MEREQNNEQPTLKTLLGYDPVKGNEYGIINEYQGYIHRRAYDYLMVGFVTDVDQTEAQREARYESYLDTIESDLGMYRSDAAKWNQEHADNIDDEKCQKQIVDGELVRRQDAPTPDDSASAIIDSSVVSKIPSRAEIRAVSREGIGVFFDQALEDAYQLLTSRLEFIAADLQTAPEVDTGDRAKTFNELLAERDALIESMQPLHSRIKEIPSELISAPYEPDESGRKTRDELLTEHKNVREEYAQIGRRLDAIKRELPDARLEDVMTRSELVSEYAAVVSRLQSLEKIKSFVPAIDEQHTLRDELRPVTGKLAVIGSKVLQLAGLRSES